MTKEEKLGFFNSYRTWTEKIKKIELEITELRISQTCPSLNADGMPHSSGASDLSKYMVKLEEKEEELRRAQSAADTVKKLIIKVIDQEIEYAPARTLFRMKYIDLEKCFTIEKALGYSKRSVYQLHDRFLKKVLNT